MLSAKAVSNITHTVLTVPRVAVVRVMFVTVLYVPIVAVSVWAAI